MNKLTVSSRSAFLVCPLGEEGKLRLSAHDSMCCDSCSGFLSGATLQTLWQIAALPNALGSHACECGHPEMRRLLDGTYHCPACGSEVLPLGAPLVNWKSADHGEAYWAGWLDGRFRANGSFVDNPNLARFKEPSDRLGYYRGHRAGRESRSLRYHRRRDAALTAVGRPPSRLRTKT